MIKKVKVSDLQPGVFIHDFNCDWGEGNIYIEKMLVRDLKIVDIVKSWGIEEVYIDTERGKDVGPSLTARPNTNQFKTRVSPPSSTHTKTEAPRNPIPFALEAREAIQLRRDAVNVIKDTINRVNEGKSPNVELTYELAGRMKLSLERNRDALLLLTRIRKKDEYTLYHSISVSSLLLNFCDHKGLPEKQTLDLAVAALFHDIGKTKVPDSILNKPGKLNQWEFNEMKKHVEFSVDLLHKAKNLPAECYDIALHHHERVDGSGYPHGLTQDKIGYGVQLTTICDVFDAVTSARCYKEAMGTVAGLKTVYEASGSHFNKDLAHEFIRCIGVYPVGTCVRLEDGKVGIIAESTNNMMKPVVKVFRDARRREKFKPFLLDLSHTTQAICGYEDPKSIGIQPTSLLTAVLAT